MSYRLLAIVILLILLLFLGIGVFREYGQGRAVASEIERLQAEELRLVGEKAEALSLIAKLSSEYYLESQARTKENLGLPGEQAILVVDDQNSAVIPIAENYQPKRRHHLADWWEYFFGAR
ncbi:MAG: septum formation initiator family protein [Patescibacteria group bacterium]